MKEAVEDIFKNRKVNLPKLVRFGFELKEQYYVYDRVLLGSGFQLTVAVTAGGEITATVTDPAFDEPYTLHLADTAVGSFVGEIRKEYEQTLIAIASSCFDAEVFKSAQAKELINYVNNVYGDDLEFLWKKFVGNAVWRRKDTQKWYGVLLTVPKSKIVADCGALVEEDNIVEVIDIRIPQDGRNTWVDNKKYFAGYHMNKKHWITIILDDSVATEEICRLIDNSYVLAVR